MKVRVQEIDLLAISEQEKRSLLKEVEEKVILSIWPNFPLPRLEEIFSSYQASFSVIQLYFSEEDLLVGFAFSKCHCVSMSQGEELFVRGFAAMQKEFRGKSKTDVFYFRCVCRSYGISWRKRLPLFILYGSFSPSTYYQVAKYSPFIVPHPNKALTDVQKNRFMELARYMGFSVSEEKPYLFPSAMLLADKATTHETWKLHPSPWVQFYLRECPGYGETEGMLVTLPVTLPRFLFSAGIFVAKRMALWLGFQKHSRQKIEEKLSRQLPKQ